MKAVIFFWLFFILGQIAYTQIDINRIFDVNWESYKVESNEKVLMIEESERLYFKIKKDGSCLMGFSIVALLATNSEKWKFDKSNQSFIFEPEKGEIAETIIFKILKVTDNELVVKPNIGINIERLYFKKLVL